MKGHRELIRLAGTVAEVRQLHLEVENFAQASDKTIRRCERAAKRRIKELEALNER